MLNFYPGPSKIYPFVSDIFLEGFEKGIFERNHRSSIFHELFQGLKNNFNSYFNIPLNYNLGVISSATEAWNIVNESFSHLPFEHHYSGAFGEKWYHYNTSINCQVNSFDPNSGISINSDDTLKVICITTSETSNGSIIPQGQLLELRKLNPNAIIAVDATSIFGAEQFDISLVDICFFSVQKCLGQPSGMGVIIWKKGITDHCNNKLFSYNSLKNIEGNSEKNETTHTPNISGVYLLSKTIEKLPSLSHIENIIKDRNKIIENTLNKKGLSFIVSNESFRSKTIITFSETEELINKIHSEAISQNIIIGKGYGKLKNTSIRIANFPAHEDIEIERLINFIKNF